MTEESSPPRFSLAQVAQMTGVAERNIRFYIQMELVPRPHGKRRGAWYDGTHVEKVLEVKRLSEKGLSLAAIRETLKPAADKPQTVGPAPGSVSVRTHIALADGLELVIDPLRLPFSQAALRRLAKAIAEECEAASRWDDEQMNLGKKEQNK